MKVELNGKFEKKKNGAFNASSNIERVKQINEFDREKKPKRWKRKSQSINDERERELELEY